MLCEGRCNGGIGCARLRDLCEVRVEPQGGSSVILIPTIPAVMAVASRSFTVVGQSCALARVTATFHTGDLRAMIVQCAACPIPVLKSPGILLTVLVWL